MLLIAVAFPATAGVQVESHQAKGLSPLVEGLMGHVGRFLGLNVNLKEEPFPAIPPEDGTKAAVFDEEPPAELAPEMDPNG